MIFIYRKGRTDVVLNGHAGSDVYGHDLICAGVSALALTLEANVRALGRNKMLARSLVRLEPGHTRIRCDPYPEHGEAAREAFDCICRGFALLAKRYPDHVQYLSAGTDRRVKEVG